MTEGDFNITDKLVKEAVKDYKVTPHTSWRQMKEKLSLHGIESRKETTFSKIKSKLILGAATATVLTSAIYFSVDKNSENKTAEKSREIQKTEVVQAKKSSSSHKKQNNNPQNKNINKNETVKIRVEVPVHKQIIIKKQIILKDSIADN